MKYTPEQIKNKIKNGEYNFDFQKSEPENEKRKTAEEIQQSVRDRSYNIDYDHINNIKKQVAEKNITVQNQPTPSQRAVDTIVSQNTSKNTTPVSTYKEAKANIRDRMKSEKQQYHSDRNDIVGKAIKGALTFWNDNDNITDKDKTNFQNEKEKYKSNRNEYKTALDEIKTAEKSERETKAYTALQDAEINSLIDAVYQNTYVIPNELAQQANENYQNKAESNFGNNASAWTDYRGRYSDMRTGAKIEASNKAYEEAMSALESKGYSKDDIEDMLDFYKREKDGKYTKEVLDTFKEMQDEGGFVGNVMANVGAISGTLSPDNNLAMAENVLYGIAAKKNDEYISLNTNSPAHLGENVKRQVTETTSQKIQQNIIDNGGTEIDAKIANFLYNTGISTAQYAVTLPASSMMVSAGGGKILRDAASLGVIASSSATSTAMEANDRGLSADKSATLGIIAGAAEIITEHCSIEALFNSNVTGVRYILQNAFTEGSEEVASDLINYLADFIVSADKSEVMQSIQNYVNQGLTQNEAIKKTLLEQAENVGLDFLGGALSGAALSSAGTTAQTFSNNQNYRAEGKAIKSLGNDAVQAVINEGLAQGTNTASYKAASQMLSQNYETDSFEVSSDVSSKKLGKLQQMNVQSNDVATFSEAVANETNADSLINTFNKITQGKSISKSKATEILNNSKARSVLSELTDIDSIETDKSSAKDIINEVSTSYRYYSANTFANNDFKRTRNNINVEQDKEDATAEVPQLRIPINKSFTQLNGTEDTIQNIESVKAGKVYLNTANGNVVDASSVKFNDGETANLYNSASAYSTDVAKAYVFGYSASDYNGTLHEYNTGFNAVYKAQKQGYSFNDAYNLALEVSNITPMQAEIAYNASKNEVLNSQTNINAISKKSNDNNTNKAQNGSQRANEEKEKSFNKVLTANKKPGATVLAENMSKSQKAETELLDSLAKHFDSEVIVVTDTNELGYGDSNGFYHNGKIVLPLNNIGGFMSVYFGHETFHDLKANSKEDAQKLQDFIIDYLKNSDSYDYNARFDELCDIYKEHIEGKTDAEVEDYINEEIAANACFSVFTEEENVTRLVKENKTLAQKVRDFFSDFADKIKKALVSIAKGNPEYRALQHDYETKQKIVEMFDIALKNRQKNNTTKGSETKWSLAKDFDSEYEKAIRNDEYYKNNVFVIGKIPNLYAEFGLDTSLDLTITSKHLRNAVKPKNLAKHQHGLSKAIIKNAVLKLNNPALVSYNDNGVLYVTVDEVDSENIPITFVVKPNGSVYISDKRETSNHALSIYGRDNTYNFINNSFNENKVLLVNKKEIAKIELVLGKQFSDKQINSDFTNSISKYKQIVNNNLTKRSLKDLESQYLTYAENGNTEQAQAIVDEKAKRWGAYQENGEIVKFYHGTLAKKITKFEKDYIGSRYSFDDRGFFFIDRESIAKDYATSDYGNNEKGSVIDSYLQLKNPLIFDKSFSLKNGYGNVFRDNDAIDVWDAYQSSILEEADNNNSDGIIIKDSIDNIMAVVFEPNQIKSADPITYDDDGKVIPLSERFNEKDADIRFSIKQDSQGNELTEQQQEYFKDSKVRDEEGNLLVIYHGTDAEFTIFDSTKSRANMDIQGNFFSPWDIDAKGYGSNVKPYYLNIKNPADERTGYAALKAFQGQNNAGIKARNLLIDMGYDGVNNNDEEYIAFYPNQIKEITNSSPTDSEDIRFSKKENSMYSYDALVSKPDMPFTEITDGINFKKNGTTRKQIIDNAINNAKSIGRENENGNAVIYVYDISKEIIVPKKAIQHSLDRRIDVNAPIVENVGNILKNSIRINELTPRTDNIEQSYVLIGAAKNQQNEPYIVSFVVNEFTNEVKSIDVLYSVNAKKEPAGSSKSPKVSTLSTGSKISISNLIDYVNKYFPDILSEDVLKHYGYDRRPDGKLGDSALFSRKEKNMSYQELLDNNEELQEMNENLQQMLKLVSTENDTFRKQFDIKTVRNSKETGLSKTTAYLRKTYGSNINKADLVSKLTGLYNYIANAGEDIDNDYIWNTSKDIATEVLSQTEYKDTSIYDEYKEVRDYIRLTRILVPEEVREDMTDYNSFRTKNFGHMRLSNTDGISLDTIHSELANNYPEFFSKDAVLSEQLEEMANFFEQTQPVIHNGAEELVDAEGLSLDEYTNIVASDIFNQYFDIPEVKSYVSGTNQKELEHLKNEYEKRINNLRELYRDRYEEQLSLLKKDNEQRLEAMKNKNDKALEKLNKKRLDDISKQKAHFKDVSKRGTDRRKSSDVKRKIKNLKNTLDRKLLNPSETSYVPTYLVKSIIDVCDTITTADRQFKNGNLKAESTILKLDDLHRQYQKLSEESDYDYKSEYDPEMQGKISALADALNGKQISELSLNELEDVYDVLKDIKNTLTDATKQIAREEKISNHESGVRIIKELNDTKGMNRTIIGKYEMNTLNPIRAIRKITEYNEDSELYKLTMELNKGQRKADKFRADASKPFDSLIEQHKEYKSFKEDLIEVPIVDNDGNNLKLTQNQIAQLIMTAKRKQGITHIESGGIKVANAKLLQKGKITDAKIKGYSIDGISVEQILSLYNNLSEYAKEWIAKADYLFNEVGKNAINETSLVLKHRKIATAENYIPLVVDSDYTGKEIEGLKVDKTIEGMGSLKSVVPNASQPLVINGLTTVIEKHIDDVAKYNGLAIPIRNFNKAYKVKTSKYYDGDLGNASVQSTLHKKWGTFGTDMVDSMLSDLQSSRTPRQTSYEFIGQAFDKIQQGFVQATLAGNISVTIKQAASYPTAGAVLSSKALTSGLKAFAYRGAKLDELFSEIDEHTGTHYKRRIGMSTQEIGDLTKSNAFMTKLPKEVNPMKWIQAMDVQTTAALWVASKTEVKSLYPQLTEGSKEYWKAVTDLYDRTIEETQPNYDTLHRPEVQKTTNKVVKSVVMFKTQPLQNTGILYDAVFQLRAKEEQFNKGKCSAEELKRAKKTVFKAITSQLAAAYTFATMSLLASMLKHGMSPYRDDDKNVTLASVLKGYFSSIASLLASVILPISGGELYELGDRIFSKGPKYDIISMPLISTLNDFINSVSELTNTSVGLVTGDSTISDEGGAILNVVTQSATMLGIPLDNAIAYTKGTWANIQDIVNGEVGSFDYGVEKNNKQKLNSIEKQLAKGDTSDYDKLSDEIYSSSSAYDLLYIVLKQYGYNSSMYNQAKDKCISIKQKNGATNPNPDASMKSKALKEYADLKSDSNASYSETEEQRQLCIKLYGSMQEVAEALEKLNK